MTTAHPAPKAREWSGQAVLVRDVAPELLRTAEELTKRAEDAPTYPTFVFLASEATPDSYNDIVLQEWDLSRYNKNPIILWGHNSWDAPIGRGKAFLDSGKLYIAVTVWDSPKCERGAQVAEGIRDGFINAGSVGFRSRKVTSRALLPKTDPQVAESGYLLGDNLLYEFSICSIPALPSAVVQRSAGRHARGADVDVQRDGGEEEIGDPDLAFAVCLTDLLQDLVAECARYAGEDMPDPELAKLARDLVSAARPAMETAMAWIEAELVEPAEEPVAAPPAPAMDVTASAGMSPPSGATASLSLSLDDFFGKALGEAIAKAVEEADPSLQSVDDFFADLDR